MGATVQLNIRMDRSLKEAGDEALAQIGLNPSQAIRALWEKASRRGADLDEVSTLLCGRDKLQANDASTIDEVLSTSWTLVEDMLASYNLTYTPIDNMPDDSTLLEEALYERLTERGLA